MGQRLHCRGVGRGDHGGVFHNQSDTSSVHERIADIYRATAEIHVAVVDIRFVDVGSEPDDAVAVAELVKTDLAEKPSKDMSPRSSGSIAIRSSALRL